MRKVFLVVAFLIAFLCGCHQTDELVADDILPSEETEPFYEPSTSPSEESTSPSEESKPINKTPAEPPQKTVPPEERPVTINGRSFTMKEINAEVQKMLNSMLYYHGDDDTSEYIIYNKDIILHKDVEYDLYINPPDPRHWNLTMLDIVITNFHHPLSSEEKLLLLYNFGVPVTEWGLRSKPYTGNYIVEEHMYNFVSDKTFLGSYTMRLDEITKPEYEPMGSEWEENAKNAIRLYMDKNDYYADDLHNNLAPGNYHVYVQEFFKSDEDSYIFFEHENGNVYWGWYFSVQMASGEHPASLHKVELVENPDDPWIQLYYEKVRSDPALSFEYEVRQGGGQAS